MSEILINNVDFAGGGKYNVKIKGNLISSIEKVAEESDGTSFEGDSLGGEVKVIDGRGKVLLPGFVNMHTHSSMTLMRGAREDDKLQSWLKN